MWKFLKIPPDPKLKRCKPMVLGMLCICFLFRFENHEIFGIAFSLSDGSFSGQNMWPENFGDLAAWMTRTSGTSCEMHQFHWKRRQVP
jgi:hypothetical protein